MEYAEALAEYRVAQDRAKRSRKKVDGDVEVLAVTVHAAETQFHLALSEYGSFRYSEGLDKTLEIVHGMLNQSKMKYQTALAELQDKKEENT